MNEKRCSRCGLIKPVSEFHKNASRKDGLSAYCKSCTKEIYPAYKKAYREKKPDAYVNEYRNHRERKLNDSRKQQAERLELLWSLKTPCVKCGEERKCSIHFHHIDPSKKIAALSRGCLGKASIIEEAKKCVCLCANCHEEFHYIYGHNPEKPIEALKEYLGGDILDEITREQA